MVTVDELVDAVIEEARRRYMSYKCPEGYADCGEHYESQILTHGLRVRQFMLSAVYSVVKQYISERWRRPAVAGILVRVMTLIYKGVPRDEAVNVYRQALKEAGGLE